METEEIKNIGEIDFRDIKIKVYYHPDNKNKLDAFDCVWQARNPDSFYKGSVYMNDETGEISYPEGAIIPYQTEEDKEILPKFIIVGHQELNDNLINLIKARLESEYLKKNNK